MSVDLSIFIRKIKELIPKKEELSDLCFGEVVSINPLEIKVDNKFFLKEKFLMLGALVQETIIKVPVNDNFQHQHVISPWATEVADGHTHGIPQHITELAHPEIMLWRGLKKGDKVRMLRCFSGQLYYIIERQGVITNDPNG